MADEQRGNPAPMARPFFPGRKPAPAPEPPPSDPIDPDPGHDAPPAPWQAEEAETTRPAAAQPAPAQAPAGGDPFPWEMGGPADEIGTAEPIGELHELVLEEAVDEPAPAADESADAFPTEAFFVPEGAEHTPVGVPVPHHEDVTQETAAELAARLEAMGRRLRQQGARALTEGMTGTNRLDALLSALLSGYLAGKDDHGA